MFVFPEMRSGGNSDAIATTVVNAIGADAISRFHVFAAQGIDCSYADVLPADSSLYGQPRAPFV